MLVRRETPADVGPIRVVIEAAFAGSGEPGRVPPEARLVDELRAGPAWLPHLSLVATNVEGEVVGHVLCTRAEVSTAPTLALGPLSVRPDQQGRGVGHALVHSVLGAADALDEPLVALLGDPGYYGRFGFRRAEDYGIVPPVPLWREHFQVRTLTSFMPSLHGLFRYPEPFDQV